MTQVEMDTAVKNMKKGGYHYTLTALHVIMNILSPLIFLILNMLFYVSYPISLAVSLLVALQKKGNLMLPQNYRGIQMLPTIGARYERIIQIA